MTQGRALKASRAWKQLFCAPNGELTTAGRMAVGDLAKYCRAGSPPTTLDASGSVDALATMECIGMQKLFRRICTLLALEERQIATLAMMPLQDELGD